MRDMKTILGIDEAGRGAVVGPLIIVGLAVEDRNLAKLKALGVRDSKELSPAARERLENKIKAVAKDYVVLKVSAKQIDQLRTRQNLNQIEYDHFVDIIKAMKPDLAIIDCPSQNTKRVLEELKPRAGKTKLVVENYADQRYPIVAAASILAKVSRDRAISALEKKFGEEIGAGYPGDERTIKFLKRTWKKYKSWPDYVRSSWITAARLKKEGEQSRLGEFV
jgi:ribonuclease HII